MEDNHTSSDFVPLYKEIAEEIGVENTVKLFMHFKGQQMTCPQRLFSIDYVKKYVKNPEAGTTEEKPNEEKKTEEQPKETNKEEKK